MADEHPPQDIRQTQDRSGPKTARGGGADYRGGYGAGGLSSGADRADHGEAMQNANSWDAPGVTPAFVPSVFVDISDFLDAKLVAFGCYRSQVRAFPSERSTEALEALARLRGATVHRNAAEAFMLIREVG